MRASAVTALVLAFCGGSAAIAQAGGGNTPLPGAGDSTRITSGNREANAEYNRLIGAGTATSTEGDEKPRRKRGAVPAALADITPGTPLRDSKGERIATIVSVEGENAMVDTGATKINVPVSAFGKDDEGLLLGITAAQFNDLVSAAAAN